MICLGEVFISFKFLPSSRTWHMGDNFRATNGDRLVRVHFKLLFLLNLLMLNIIFELHNTFTYDIWYYGALAYKRDVWTVKYVQIGEKKCEVAPENRIDSFHISWLTTRREYAAQMSQNCINTKQGYKTTRRQPCRDSNKGN